MNLESRDDQRRILLRQVFKNMLINQFPKCQVLAFNISKISVILTDCKIMHIFFARVNTLTRLIKKRFIK